MNYVEPGCVCAFEGINAIWAIVFVIDIMCALPPLCSTVLYKIFHLRNWAK
jgi:hypothetical protein